MPAGTADKVALARESRPPAIEEVAAVTEAATVRKTVTVLFCDVMGSTSLGEHLDPEALRELMARYFANVVMARRLRASLET
jgi:class 3 adenylate cyclase